MMKKTLYLLICLLILSGCGSSRIKSSSYLRNYLPGEDFEPTAQSWQSRNMNVCPSEKGLYFIAGTYLFFMDYDSMEARPLCYKTDCLHNQENDSTKTAFCNAFVGASYVRQYIGQYKDKLYTVCINTTNGSEDLIEMEPDGSSRKTILADLKKTDVTRILLHRGVFYYTSNTYTEAGVQRSCLHALSLLSDTRTPEIIYEAAQDHFISGVFPYLDQVYFIDSVEERQDDGNILPKQHILSYQLKDQSVQEITEEGIYTICGVRDSKLIIQNNGRYDEYDPSSKELKPCTSGFTAFAEAHPGWNCHAECIQDDFTLFTCFDRKETNDFIYDTFVADRNGNLLATIPEASWGHFNSQMIRIDKEEYLFRCSRTIAPFSVNLYKKTDLMQGIVDPITLIAVEDLNTDLNNGYILPHP